MSLTITKLASRIGAEVGGIDLCTPPTAGTLAALNRALLDHQVLVLRDQAFTPSQYLQAAAAFGTPMRQHYSQYNLAELPDVSVISHRDGQGVASMWHTDHTNHPCPPKATLLYGVEIPSRGGDTSFANMAAVYVSLPEELRSRIAGLQTLNGFDAHRSVLAEDADRYAQGVPQPLVRTHPETGVPALYFHITKAERIKGMTPQDSAALLEELLTRAVGDDVVYRHRWRPGDMLICDNRCVMHRVHDDYDHNEKRLLYRIILEGDRPF